MPKPNTHARKDIAVFIGRFQPLHNGHLALLNHALEMADHVVIVIGSAFQASTPKNPFSWVERREMIKLAVPASDQGRVAYLPMRDHYDEDRWVRAVHAGVEQLAAGRVSARRPDVAVIGHFKDATSDYLRRFEGWELIAAERASPIDGAHIRDAYFGCGGGDIDATLAALASVAPASTLAFLRAWRALPAYARLVQEWQVLQQYKQAWSAAPYPPVFVTVDAVVKCADKVLLIQRGQAPGVGLYAVPGGFIEQRETTYQSALRELREETRLGLLESTMKSSLKNSAVFDHPDRSQRGRTITHAFYFDLGNRSLPDIEADDDAQSAQWMPIDQLAAMEDRFHDDHFHMLDHFLGLTSDRPG